MFWKRKSSEPEPEGGGETAPQGQLAPVRILTAASTIDGWIDLGRQRLSDVLNVEDLLSVSSVPVAPTRDHWFVVERDEMLLVVPPSHVTDRALRRHRVRRPIVVASGHYRVQATVHLLPGIELDSYLGRTGNYFLPLTDATVSSAERPEVHEQHGALLVNVRSPGQPLQLQVLE